MPQRECVIERRLTTGTNGLLLIRDGMAGSPVKVVVRNGRMLNTRQNLDGSEVTVGADKVQGIEQGLSRAIDAGGQKTATPGPSGATYSRSRITVAGPTNVEKTIVPGGTVFLQSFDYPEDSDLIIRIDGDALASSPPKTVVASPAAAKTISGTLASVANLYEAGQGLALIPGTVAFSLDLDTSGSVVYRDLAGDGLLYGPHGWGKIDYRSGDYELYFAENMDTGTAFEVDFETTLDTHAERLFVDVEVHYTAYYNVDGL